MLEKLRYFDVIQQTICTEFILRCLIVYGIRAYIRMKNGLLTYFEKAETKHKGDVGID